MKTNLQLEKDIKESINWEPLLRNTDITVVAKDGIITLSGVVDSFHKKTLIESVVKNVFGVNAVVEKLEVKLDLNLKLDDEAIAVEVVNALRMNLEIPNEKIKVKVEKGWVTLDGEVNWNFERESAKKAISCLAGVKVVISNLRVKPESHDEVEKAQIESALDRNWAIDSDDIEVIVSGTKVTLNGTVDTWYQKNEAERIAWNAPGVWTVINSLAVEYDHEFAD
ncbi:MAG TPA: BON domain-containing protein [Bacteroidia bacterium]|jgi:osmotically-inducible protein OsmY|nr:BON domain-containing protein [Bacteroidia bacterium]HQF26983.1 BON domain-containing protein [Bacteroidia bacterium]HQK96426.1 BON domain-containing protein [Bacteroidia bacterium]